MAPEPEPGQGNTVLVTGAAAGIGRATARRFHAAGWRVTALDRDAGGLKELSGELGNERCLIWTCDVTSGPDLEAAVSAHRDRFGPGLDVFVNNAGVLGTGAFADMDLAAHRTIVEVNALGAMAALHAVFPLLKSAPAARVVNISSASAEFGSPEFASYSASKFFVRGLTEALAVEWRRLGIHVCHVMPAFVATDMVAGLRTASMDRLGVRLGPEDIALVVYRAATGRRRLTWPVGGGFRLLRILLGPAPEAVKLRVVGWITGY